MREENFIKVRSGKEEDKYNQLGNHWEKRRKASRTSDKAFRRFSRMKSDF